MTAFRRHLAKTSKLIALVLPAVLSATPASLNAASHQIDIVIVTGGKQFNEAEFFSVFKSMSDVRYEHQRFGEGAESALSKKLAHRYDVMVFYDINNEYDSHRDGWVDLLKVGQPTLFLHHALGANTDWSEYDSIVGGRARFGPTPGPNVTTYHHDVELKVQIADTSHPITQGLKPFTIVDEAYKNTFVNQDVNVLLTVESDLNDRIIAWTHRYTNSPIVYIQLGHGPSAYRDSNFRLLLENAIRWLAKR